jgi:hypothetical protein
MGRPINAAIIVLQMVQNNGIFSKLLLKKVLHEVITVDLETTGTLNLLSICWTNVLYNNIKTNLSFRE